MTEMVTVAHAIQNANQDLRKVRSMHGKAPVKEWLVVVLRLSGGDLR